MSGDKNEARRAKTPLCGPTSGEESASASSGPTTGEESAATAKGTRRNKISGGKAVVGDSRGSGPSNSSGNDIPPSYPHPAVVDEPVVGGAPIFGGNPVPPKFEWASMPAILQEMANMKRGGKGAMVGKYIKECKIRREEEEINSNERLDRETRRTETIVET